LCLGEIKKRQININIMTENEIARIVVNICIEIHRQTGPGLLEKVYEEILFHELIEAGLKVKRQQAVSILWKNHILPSAFCADLIINEKVILELKSVSEIQAVHYKQLLTYLKLTNKKLGLLINFNEDYVKDGIRRVVNNL